MNQESERIYRSLSVLLAEAQRDAHLKVEIVRAGREFFLGDSPPETGGSPDASVAWTRFAEWYLLERESEVRGAVPLDVLWPDDGGDRGGLAGSIVGVFLTEVVNGNEGRLRDMQDDRVLDVDFGTGLDPQAGDMWVGRLYGGNGGPFTPSPVIARQRDAVAVARAFQQDYRTLQTERRLSQAEIEQLMFAVRGAVAATVEPSEPIEHLEAKLETLLRQAGSTDSATDIAGALARSRTPGPVVGPLLDKLAFESDVDLGATQKILLKIWNHHHASPAAPPRMARRDEVDVDTEPSTDEPRVEPRTPKKRPPSRFAPRPGESLGEAMARRIEEGIRNEEDVAAVFEQVEAMLGGDLGDNDDADDANAAAASADEDADADGEDVGTFDDGDLEMLVREFVWETGADAVTQQVLDEWIADQRRAPVPRLDVEAIEADDLLRHLVRIYLQSPPTRRELQVRTVFTTIETFYRWVSETQGYDDLDAALAPCREQFLASLHRVQAASLSLGGSDAPGAMQPQLYRVTDVAADGLGVVGIDDGERLRLAAKPKDLRAGDVVLAPLTRLGSDRARVDGMAIVLPGSVEPLLG